MVRQLRGTAGPSQIEDAACLQWGTVWGDSFLLQGETMTPLSKPLPRIGSDNAPFWEGTRQGVLRLPYCTACGHSHLPARSCLPVMPVVRAGMEDGERPRSHSTYTVVYKEWFAAFAADIPYNVIQVELKRGTTLTANLIDPPPGARPSACPWKRYSMRLHQRSHCHGSG